MVESKASRIMLQSNKIWVYNSEIYFLGGYAKNPLVANGQKTTILFLPSLSNNVKTLV
jgi:hypothetical protein